MNSNNTYHHRNKRRLQEKTRNRYHQEGSKKNKKIL